MNRLSQVPSYPEDANEPVISTVDGDAHAVAWPCIVTIEGNKLIVAEYSDFVKEVVQSRIEQIAGVAKSALLGTKRK